MQTQLHHAAMLSALGGEADDGQDRIACWLAGIECELQEALEQSRASSQRCLTALEALAQLRAFLELGRGRAPVVVTPTSLRVLTGLPPIGGGVEHRRQDEPGSAMSGAMHGCLSPREREVLIQIAGGQSNKQIAQQLALSIRTVERHINNIYRKIDAQNKADATAWALRHHLA